MVCLAFFDFVSVVERDTKFLATDTTVDGHLDELRSHHLNLSWDILLQEKDDILNLEYLSPFDLERKDSGTVGPKSIQ